MPYIVRVHTSDKSFCDKISPAAKLIKFKQLYAILELPACSRLKEIGDVCAQAIFDMSLPPCRCRGGRAGTPTQGCDLVTSYE